MKEYIGIKFVKAEPMTKSEAIELGYAKSYGDDKDQEGYKVVYPSANGKEYTSWSPKFAFEKAYKELDLMKQGK